MRNSIVSLVVSFYSAFALVQGGYMGCFPENVTSPWLQFNATDNCTTICQLNDFTFSAVSNGSCFCGHHIEVDEVCCSVPVYSVCGIGHFRSDRVADHNCDAQCHCIGHCSYPDGQCEGSCLSGWTGPSCQYRDCDADNGGCEQRCIPNQIHAWCACFDGYRSIEGHCGDVDECEYDPCSHQCLNTPGGFQCSCDAGFKINDDGRTCDDIDECLDMEQCHHCVNSPGSFTCICNEGYSLANGSQTCSDIDECLEPTSCQHICRNVDGSYECSCHRGYQLVGETECVDIDECGEDNGACNHVCHNFLGGYSCSCNEGYELVTDHYCADRDECSEATMVPLCEQHCNNTEGSYRCLCDEGFVASGDVCLPCDHGWFGSNCSLRCDCDGNSCDAVNGTCAAIVCPFGESSGCSLTSEKEARVGLTAALVVLFLCIWVAVISATVVLFRKRRTASHPMPRMIIESRDSLRNSRHSIIDTAILRVRDTRLLNISEVRESNGSRASEASLANADDERAALTKSAEQIDVSCLSLETTSEKLSTSFISNEEFVLKASRIQNDKVLMKEEFLSIPLKVHDCYEVPKDLKKNRFKDIKPYKHNRVVLTDVDEADPYSDYINASHILGYALMEQVIAAQGPRPNTVAEFLQMLWEQSASCVVMLTREVEGGKRKCTSYWHKVNEPKTYGQFTVEVTEEEKWLDYSLRRLRLKKEGSGGSRMITQLHFMGWPDHGTPDISSLLRLRRRVKKESQRSGVIVVHCSAGVGRTGTYIALNWLLHQSETEGGIDIAGCVQALRKSRVNMVQTFDQYSFLYEAMHYALSIGETSASIHNFTAYAAQMRDFDGMAACTEIEKQFTYLQRNQEPLTRPLSLFDDVPSSPLLIDDGVDATCVDSIRYHDEYIACGWPKQAGSFWRMVAYSRVQNVVIIKGPADVHLTSLLDQPGVSCCQVERTGDISLTRVLLSHGEGDEQVGVNVFMAQLEPETHGLMPLSTIVTTLRRMYGGQERKRSKCMVVCRDGSTLTGQFLVLTALMDMISLLNEADVFFVVRLMKMKKPEFIPSLVQFKHLYKVVEVICAELDAGTQYQNV